jgi:hypothetical protein
MGKQKGKQKDLTELSGFDKNSNPTLAPFGFLY